MTTTAKLQGALRPAAAAGLAPWIERLYAEPGARRVGMIELHAIERTEPAPDSDRAPAVKLAITHLELGQPEQDDVLRASLNALFVHRTAAGTLTETGDIELATSTLDYAAGDLHAMEAARLRVAVTALREQALKALATPELSLMEARLEIDRLADRCADILALAPGGAE